MTTLRLRRSPTRRVTRRIRRLVRAYNVFEPAANDSEGTLKKRCRRSASASARSKHAVKLIALVTARRARDAPHAGPSRRNPADRRCLRDTEIEQLLRDYTRPILRAAGLQKQNIQMVIINDKSFNAFVADGRRIFVNYGAHHAIDNAEPDHRRARARDRTSRRRPPVEVARAACSAQTQMIIAMLLGAGAIAAGRRPRQRNSGLAARPARPRSAHRRRSTAEACWPTSASRRKTPTAPA